jgi:hypothetical protein
LIVTKLIGSEWIDPFEIQTTPAIASQTTIRQPVNHFPPNDRVAARLWVARSKPTCDGQPVLDRRQQDRVSSPLLPFLVLGLQRREPGGEFIAATAETKTGRVAVSGKPSHTIPPGTLQSIFTQAGWEA